MSPQHQCLQTSRFYLVPLVSTGAQTQVLMVRELPVTIRQHQCVKEALQTPYRRLDAVSVPDQGTKSSLAVGFGPLQSTVFLSSSLPGKILPQVAVAILSLVPDYTGRLGLFGPRAHASLPLPALIQQGNRCGHHVRSRAIVVMHHDEDAHVPVHRALRHSRHAGQSLLGCH